MLQPWWDKFGWVPVVAVLAFILGGVSATFRFQPDAVGLETVRLEAVANYVQTRRVGY